MRSTLAADVLVAVGVALGVPVAELLYHSLASEPVDAYGQRVDWTVIRARIETARRLR